SDTDTAHLPYTTLFRSRLRETGITLPLRRCGPLSRPSREDLRKRIGTSAFEAGLLRLWPMPPWILPAGPSAETGIVFPDAWSSAHDCQRGSAGELRGERCAVARIGGRGSQCQVGGTGRRSAGGRDRRG